MTSAANGGDSPHSASSAPPGSSYSAASSVSALSEIARSTWVAGNCADAQRLKACYALLRECVRAEMSGAGDESAPGYSVVDSFDVCSNHLVAVFAISSGRADTMITLAVNLTERYPAILQALSEGRMDQRAAELLARQMRTVDDSVIARVQQEVVDAYLAAIEGGQRLGTQAIRDAVDEIIGRHDREGIRLRREDARRERGVNISKGFDGMSTLWATLANDEAAVLAEKLDQRAAQFAEEFAAAQAAKEADSSQGAGSSPDADSSSDSDFDVSDVSKYSLAERRADALMSIVCGDDDAGGTASPLRPKVTVIAAPVGNAGTSRSGASNPGAAAGAAFYGAGGAEPAVQFPRTGESSIRALLDMLATSSGASLERIDPTIGAADDPSRERKYRPSAALARAIRLRDGTCRHPGCTVDAEQCDLDHVCPFNLGDPDKGGRTCECNLMCLCRKHHRFKTFADWSYTMDPDGTLVVVAPNGTTMLTRPSGPLAQYRRELERDEADKWERQARRMPDADLTASLCEPATDPASSAGPAEPTFWNRHAARTRAHRRQAARAKEHGRSRPPARSRRTSRATNPGQPEPVVSKVEQQIRELLDEPPF